VSEFTCRKASGYFQETGLWGELKDGETLSCCHCGGIWILQKGSGKARGFCQQCDRVHCGGPTCWECIPYEARIENLEAGRPELTPRPTKVFIPEGLSDG